MASGMSWLGWHRSNLGLRQGAMNLQNPSVVFTTQQPFSPGDTVRGNAYWGFKHNVKIKDTKLTVHGGCKVKWTVGFGENKVNFESGEVYISKTVFNDSNTEDNLLNTQTHEISFDFELPENIPSSFSSKYGNVLYEVTLATFYSDGRLSYKETFEMPFLVKNPYDQGPEALIKLSGSENHGFCGLKSKIEFEVTTNKNFYNPGEFVCISGYVDNGSKKNLSFTKLVLTQSITFTVTSELSSHEEKKHKTLDVATWLGGEVRRGTRVLFDQVKTIKIPDIPESELKNCQAIHIEYTVKFGVKISGILSREFFSAPETVFIGNTSMESPSHKPSDISTDPKKNVYVLMKNGTFMKL